MKCQICNQNEATVFLTTVEGQKLTKLCLCIACAASKGVLKEGLSAPTLSSFMGSPPAETAPHQAGLKGLGSLVSGPNPSCDKCGMSFSDFKRTGRLGCVGCYDAFREQLTELLSGMHLGMEHLGKVAPGFDQEQVLHREIEHLKKALATAVRSEHYEEAAKLRDRIQELERRVHEHPDA
jgi:protein arginine kinase activator